MIVQPIEHLLLKKHYNNELFQLLTYKLQIIIHSYSTHVYISQVL